MYVDEWQEMKDRLCTPEEKAENERQVAMMLEAIEARERNQYTPEEYSGIEKFINYLASVGKMITPAAAIK